MEDSNKNNVKKSIWKPILAAILVAAGIICCTAVSSPDLNINKTPANQITVSTDAELGKIYVMGKMGTKKVSGTEYNYYVVLTEDKSGNKFTMGLRASEKTSDAFQSIIDSGESKELGYSLYGTVNTMDEETAQIYDSLLSQNGITQYPKLYFTFIDSGNSAGLNILLGILCFIPFLAASACLCFSFYKNVNGKSKKSA